MKDSLLFARANISEAAKLREIFKIYEDYSGQTINYDKSNLFLAKGPRMSYDMIFALYSKSRNDEEVISIWTFFS